MLLQMDEPKKFITENPLTRRTGSRGRRQLLPRGSLVYIHTSTPKGTRSVIRVTLSQDMAGATEQRVVRREIWEEFKQ